MVCQSAKDCSIMLAFAAVPEGQGGGQEDGVRRMKYPLRMGEELRYRCHDSVWKCNLASCIYTCICAGPNGIFTDMYLCIYRRGVVDSF